MHATHRVEFLADGVAAIAAVCTAAGVGFCVFAMMKLNDLIHIDALAGFGATNRQRAAVRLQVGALLRLVRSLSSRALLVHRDGH